MDNDYEVNDEGNDNLVNGIIAIVGFLFGVGGVACGVDQYQKRKKEQEENRARLQENDATLAANEQLLTALKARLNDKNGQIYALDALLRTRASER